MACSTIDASLSSVFKMEGHAGRDLCAVAAMSATPVALLNVSGGPFLTATLAVLTICSGKRQGSCRGNWCLCGKPQFLTMITGSAGSQKRGAAWDLSWSSSAGSLLFNSSGRGCRRLSSPVSLLRKAATSLTNVSQSFCSSSNRALNCLDLLTSFHQRAYNSCCNAARSRLAVSASACAWLSSLSFASCSGVGWIAVSAAALFASAGNTACLSVFGRMYQVFPASCVVNQF